MRGNSSNLCDSLLKLPCLNQYLITRARTHQATTMGIYTQNQSLIQVEGTFNISLSFSNGISIYSLQFTTTSRPIMAYNRLEDVDGSSLPRLVIHSPLIGYIVHRLGSGTGFLESGDPEDAFGRSLGT
jgi:hypothetical protein